MKKTLLRRFISVTLSLLLICAVSTTGMAAAPEEDAMYEMRISTSAGSNGVYTHDMSTGETEYIPASECVPDDVLDIIPDMEEDEGYSDLEPTMEPRYIKNYKQITSPTNQCASICHIGVRFVKEGLPDLVVDGTGWLLNNRYLMTAGHLLYSGKYGHADHVAVYVGASGGTYKQYRLGRWTLIGGDFVRNPDGEAYKNIGMYDDWGMVELDSALTINVEPLTRRVVASSSEMNSGIHYINGYPKELQSNPAAPWKNYYMYENSGHIKGDLNTRTVPTVQTDMYIPQGMSGGPVYYKSGTKCYVEGIAVAYENGPQYGVIVLYGKYINDWVNEKCG